MLILDVPSFPIESYLHDLPGLERRLASWCADLDFPVRLLTFSRPFDMTPAVARLNRGQSGMVQQLHRAMQPLLGSIAGLLAAAEAGTTPARSPSSVVAMLEPDVRAQLDALFAHTFLLDRALASDGAPPLVAAEHWLRVADALRQVVWPVPLIKEQARFYETLQQRAYARGVRHVLLAWPGEGTSPEAVVASLGHALGQPPVILDALPAAIEGEYELDEWRGLLRPTRPGQPWLAIVHSFDARGRVDARVLHPLLDVKFDVTVALDVLTLPRHRAMRGAELAYATARVIRRDSSVKDVGADRKFVDAERVMHALQDQQALHDVQVAVLVSGESEAELETNVADLIGRMGSALKLTRVAGAQGLWLKLFGATPARQIEAPFCRRNYLSDGAGCLFGVLGYHRASRTDGPLWGLDDVRSSPIFFNPFGERNEQAAHMVVLGKTGSGKTFFLNVMTLRIAALEGQRVIWIDAFENGYRLERAIGAGARCYSLGLDATVNLLDVVYTPDADGTTWLSSQVQHVISQLSLLMGDPTIGASGKKQLIPRAFSLAERGSLDRALGDLYITIDPQAPLAEMPILADLIEYLEAIDEPAATNLAYELRMLLFGTSQGTRAPTTLGRCFNGATTVDWRLRDDVVCFDLSKVEKGASELLAFFYAQIIGAVYRDMRDPQRDRARKTYLVIDEFGLAAQVEAVGQLAATMSKVSRKFGYAMVVVDQNPTTFLQGQSGRDILDNAAGRILFHLDDLPARQMGDAIGDLTASHVDYMSHATTGKCVAVFGSTVYAMSVQANALEQRMLRGS
jgi:hypothetical protein